MNVFFDVPTNHALYGQALELIEDGKTQEFVQLLHDHMIDPNTSECEFLRQAIVHNHADIFWWLLPFYQKNIDGSDVLCEASNLNRVEFIKALVPLTDPTVNQSEPLMWAARHNNVALMDFLLPLSNVFDAIEMVNRYAPKAQTHTDLPEFKGLEYLYQTLASQLNSGKEAGHKKI